MAGGAGAVAYEAEKHHKHDKDLSQTEKEAKKEHKREEKEAKKEHKHEEKEEKKGGLLSFLRKSHRFDREDLLTRTQTVTRVRSTLLKKKLILTTKSANTTLLMPDVMPLLELVQSELEVLHMKLKSIMPTQTSLFQLLQVIMESELELDPRMILLLMESPMVRLSLRNLSARTLVIICTGLATEAFRATQASLVQQASVMKKDASAVILLLEPVLLVPQDMEFMSTTSTVPELTHKISLLRQQLIEPRARIILVVMQRLELVLVRLLEGWLIMSIGSMTPGTKVLVRKICLPVAMIIPHR